MINIVPFEPRHAKVIFPKVFLKENFLPEEHLEFMWKHGLAYSVYRPLDNSFLAFGGIIPLWEGVGEMYSFITDEMKKRYPIQLHKAAKYFIKEAQPKFGFHRIQLGVEAGDFVGYRWAKALGFSNEGAMYKYTPDKKTFLRFAKVW